MSTRLEDRRIVVTGAASGIGLATALLFAREGAQLALFDRDTEGLARARALTGAQTFALDVADEVQVASAIESSAQAMGGLDGIVNSAGIQVRGSIAEVSADQWRRSFEVNVTGPYIVVRCALPWLREARVATIVNLGSGQSLLPNIPNRTAYATAKGGILNLTRSLAAELAPNIRANCVCPGLIDTPMAPIVPGVAANYALKRLGTAEEVAQAILFLTSSESSYVTGAALAVDGGRTFH